MFTVAHIGREDKVTQTLCFCPHLLDAELRCPEDLADAVLGFLQLLCHNCLLETMSTLPCVSTGQSVAPDLCVAPEICSPQHPGHGRLLIQNLRDGKGQAEAHVWPSSTVIVNYWSQGVPREFLFVQFLDLLHLSSPGGFWPRAMLATKRTQPWQSLL